MRLTTLILSMMLMGSPMAHASSPSPLGPVSRDLLVAKLHDIDKTLDKLDSGEALRKMRHLVRMLEVDAYYTTTEFLEKAREVLEHIEYDDLATADVAMEELFEVMARTPGTDLGTA